MRCGELVGLERTVSFLLEIGFINLLYYTLLGSFINNESNTRQNFLRELETLWLELNLGIWGCVYEKAQDGLCPLGTAKGLVCNQGFV